MKDGAFCFTTLNLEPRTQKEPVCPLPCDSNSQTEKHFINTHKNHLLEKTNMGRIKQVKGKKGSLKWIQQIVNEYPDVLNKQINDSLGFRKKQSIEWLSPKAEDDYAEYRDQAFLDLLGIELSKTKLKDFWPQRGPQWDALGRVKNKAYFLVEAKAHVTELISSSMAKSPSSKSLINKSLNETKTYLNLKPYLELNKGFYQYLNRLAHLYLLRKLNNIPAYLVFVYFINDHTYIPTSRDEWNGALQLMYSLLETHKHKLSKYVIDVFIDGRELPGHS